MPSAKLIAGGLAVCCAAAVLLPQMAGARHYSAIFLSPPDLFKLRTTFSDLFPNGLFLLALIAIWIVLTTRTGRTARPAPMEDGECIGWLGLLIPFAGYVVARYVTNAFVDRYFIGLLPGIAVAFSCLVWRHFREARMVSLGILSILVSFGAAAQVRTVQRPESIDPFGQQAGMRQALQLEPTLHNEGKRFFVFTDGLVFLKLNYYARHPEEYVLLLPAPTYPETPNTSRYASALGRYRPMQCWNLEDLRSHARETALLGPSPVALRAMKKAGIETTVRFAAPMEVDYVR